MPMQKVSELRVFYQGIIDRLILKLQEQKAPISETVKFASLENAIQTIKEETVLEERDKESGKIIEYRKLFVLKL